MAYYKNKFKNVKRLLTQLREKEQKETGGGGSFLTQREKRILATVEYTELALKLGISASGGDPRLDSDGTDRPVPPSSRLANRLLTIDNSNGLLID